MSKSIQHKIRRGLFMFALLMNFLLITVLVCAQQKSYQYIFANDTLYSKQSNAIAIIVAKENRDKIQVRTSQGHFFTSDNQLYVLDGLVKGSVTVKLFKVIAGKTKILEKRTFFVVTSPVQKLVDNSKVKFVFTLNGNSGGKISDSSLKKVKFIQVSQGYTFISTVAYITDKEHRDPAPFLINSFILDDTILSVFNKATPGLKLIFDEIKFKDQSGRVFTYPKTVVFEVE
jgi:hypothetical protein